MIFLKDHFCLTHGSGKEVCRPPRSPYTIFHTLNGEFDSTESLSKLEKKYSDTFLRIHASFMVNPLFVQSIRRFEVTLTDGTVLPIPDRKYAKVAKALQEWGTSSN